MDSFPPGGAAVVVGTSGGIGRALAVRLNELGCFETVVAFARSGEFRLDLTDEASIAAAADALRQRGVQPRLVINAAGVLQGQGCVAEKTWAQIDPKAMLQAFAVNTVGPALLVKHLLPLLPASGKSVFAVLSAKVGSIADNRLGGWFSYRASKAALNQIVRTAAVELGRKHKDAICVALHPGTVSTALSVAFRKAGLEVQPPASAAERLLGVIDSLEARHSGGFFDQHGLQIPW